MAKPDIKKWTGYLKEHWNKPKDGEYVSIKEFLCMACGGMGIYGVANAIGPLSFAPTANVNQVSWLIDGENGGNSNSVEIHNLHDGITICAPNSRIFCH